jgi:hypothetical protein
MCFSFEVSIGTFITTWGISLYLLNKKKLNSQQINDIYFLMIFSTMQLADAILWFIKMKKNIINYIVTSLFIPLILSSQILFNLYYRNKVNYLPLNILGIFGIIYIFFRFNGYSTSICDNYLTSPIWASNEIKFWEFLMFALLIFFILSLMIYFYFLSYLFFFLYCIFLWMGLMDLYGVF